MSKTSGKGEFTGRHMLAVLVAGFGIVVAVNFFMASVAANIFSGTVVENGYVASQKFNTWLAQAEQQKSLGWMADISQSGQGRLVVATHGVPDGARVTASIRRPIGALEDASLALANTGDGRFMSAHPLAKGRWIVRLQIEANGHQWRAENQLP